MSTRTIGDCTVHRIEELHGPGFEARQMFPDWRDEAVAEHRHWLAPDYYEPGSGRVISSIHSYVVKTPRHTILIDTCCGNHKPRPVPRWNMLDTPFIERLAAIGTTPESVDMVMCTHLHVDHVGWNTALEDGRWVPTFPNATYLFGRKEYDHWEAEHRRGNREAPVNHGSFADSVLPVVEAGKAVMIDDGHTVDDQFLVQAAYGHSPGQFTIELTSKSDKALFIGDVMHHPIQVYHPDWNSQFCLWPEQARASRRRVLEQCADRPTLMLPAHFGRPHGGRVLSHGNGFRFEFVA